jgi:prevent-host-death family protein
MKPSHISATEAARSFSDIVNRVRYRGEEFIVEKGGQEVCRIVPIAPVKTGTGDDLLRILQQFPPDEEFAADVRKGIPGPTVPESPWDR